MEDPQHSPHARMAFELSQQRRRRVYSVGHVVLFSLTFSDFHKSSLLAQ